MSAIHSSHHIPKHIYRKIISNQPKHNYKNVSNQNKLTFVIYRNEDFSLNSSHQQKLIDTTKLHAQCLSLTRSDHIFQTKGKLRHLTLYASSSKLATLKIPSIHSITVIHPFIALLYFEHVGNTFIALMQSIHSQ